MYKINPNSYSSVFVIPTQIADKHLRMAGKAQLKVLLWLYRNTTTAFDIDVISRDTGIPKDEIDDAMLYWIDAGRVVKDGVTAAPVTEPETVVSQPEKEKTGFTLTEKTVEKAPEIVPEKKEKQVVHTVKPSIKDISRRLAESPEIGNMFNEVQEVFGRTLGYDGQSNLLMLHDHYGLPADVIVMLCGYAKTIGKQGAIAYIVQMGKAWAEEGVTDFESASRKIARMENAEKIWTAFRTLTGIENPKPTSKQAQFLEVWINDFGYGIDVIYYAYEKTVEKKGKISFSYMNGVLRSWHESGYKTIAEIDRATEEFATGVQNKTEKKQETNPIKDFDPSSKNTSFNIDLIMKRSRELDPTKTKKGQ